MRWGAALWAALFLFILSAGVSSQVSAWFKKKELPPAAPQERSFYAAVGGTSPYRIYYKFKTDDSSAAGGAAQIDYKLVNENEAAGLYEAQRGGYVRFLDKEGYVLASDAFLTEEFQKTDFYGSVPVQKDRLLLIVSADAVAFREGEYERVFRRRQEAAEERKKEDDLLKAAMGESVPSAPAPEVPKLPVPASTEVTQAPPAVETPLPQAASAPPQLPAEGTIQAQPEEKESSQKKNETENSVTVPAAPAKIPREQEEIFERGGADNDAVRDVITEQEKAPPTQVEPSPSTIPEVSTEPAPQELK